MTQFYYTVSSKEIRSYMPAIPVLLAATSFVRTNQQGITRLLPPNLPAQITERAADCGGYRVATNFGGTYPFTLTQYLQWLVALQPGWAASLDVPCITADGTYPGAEVVQRRQDFTTEMAHLIWERCRHHEWSWCVTVQGFHTDQYLAHARTLAPLIREMQRAYSSPAWREKGPSYAFRVGIGSLVRYRRPAEVVELVSQIADIIGWDIPLHCWGSKLRFLQHGASLPQVLSLDSGAWNGLFGEEAHEERRASGLSVAQFSWEIAQPRYATKLEAASVHPKQHPLTFDPLPSLTAREGYQLYDVYHLMIDPIFGHLPSFDLCEPEQQWREQREQHFWRVAVVEACDREEVFRLTNNAHGSWAENREVLWKASDDLRSLSVGDVVINRSDGRASMVAPYDWRELPFQE